MKSALPVLGGLLIGAAATFVITTTQGESASYPVRGRVPMVSRDAPAAPTSPSGFIPPPLPTATPTRGPNCSPAYPTVCIPPPPPDLDCAQIPYRKFTVLPPDPHKFDSDKDGIGCES